MCTSLLRQVTLIVLISMILNGNFVSATEPTKKLSLISATTLFSGPRDLEEFDEEIRGRLLYSMDIDGVTKVGSHGGRTGDDDEPVKRTIKGILNGKSKIQLDQIFIERETGNIIIRTKKSNVAVSEEQDG